MVEINIRLHFPEIHSLVIYSVVSQYSSAVSRTFLQASASRLSKMRFSITVSFAMLLASPAQAGSRHWETPLTHSHVNGDISGKRAISVLPSKADDDGYTGIWPDKTITYAFEDSEAETKLRPMFHQAQQVWAVLQQNDFKYKEVSIRKCRRNRGKCLVIKYNDQGKLSSVIGVPPVKGGQDYEGPIMNLSDDPNMGNLDLNVNAAHELGHVWGLYHEHQNPKWWSQSHDEQGWITWLRGDIFETKDFHCENIKGYEEALENFAKDSNLPAEDLPLYLCRNYQTAAKYRFDSKDWMPAMKTGQESDDEFDEYSLMLYPSGAGGKGRVDSTGDHRRPVLTYPNGNWIPIREGPSTMDYDRLLKIYGSEYRGKSKLLNAMDSFSKRTFKKMRSTLSLRGGDTEGGLC